MGIQSPNPKGVQSFPLQQLQECISIQSASMLFPVAENAQTLQKKTRGWVLDGQMSTLCSHGYVTCGYVLVGEGSEWNPVFPPITSSRWEQTYCCRLAGLDPQNLLFGPVRLKRPREFQHGSRKAPI